MNLTASRSLLRAKVGRVYVPPLAVLYLYFITSDALYGYIAALGVIAAVSSHAHNIAVFGPEGSHANMEAQDEKVGRWLIAVFKQGRLEDYPQSWREVMENPRSLPIHRKRIPAIILTLFWTLMIWVVIGTAIIGFWRQYSSLDFVGISLLFTMAVFLLQPVIWPRYWSVSNQRDNEQLAVDSPNYRRLTEFRNEIEAKEGLQVTKNEYDISKGGVLRFECHIDDSGSGIIQAVIETIAFAYVGLFNSTAYPYSKLDTTLIDAENNEISFSINRSLVHKYNEYQITEREYINGINVKDDED